MIDDFSLMIVVSTLKCIGDKAPNFASVFRWLMRVQMLQGFCWFHFPVYFHAFPNFIRSA